jgi:hypothetical protein
LLEGNVLEFTLVDGSGRRSDRTVLYLIARSGLGRLYFRHELLADDVVESFDLLVEVFAEARLLYGPGLRALVDTSGILVAAGVVGEGVVVVLTAHNTELDGHLRAVGFGLLDGEDLEPLIAGLDNLFRGEHRFAHSLSGFLPEFLNP